MHPTKQDNSMWIRQACDHAADYLTRFVNNPGIERIVAQFDPQYSQIRTLDGRLARLSDIAAEHWDFRKGRERYEVVANEPMDQKESELGKIILEGTDYAEMTSRSSATLKHYAMLVILGGANKAPYYRLRYALEQNVTYDKLISLGCEREVASPEQAQTADYAPGARTEYDLGIGAIQSLLGEEQYLFSAPRRSTAESVQIHRTRISSSCTLKERVLAWVRTSYLLLRRSIDTLSTLTPYETFC
jgi:hypothetical protein